MSELVKPSTPSRFSSSMLPVLVCAFAIFLLSVMDAAMKSLVVAVGVYNTLLWRSVLGALVSGAGWAAISRSRPTSRALRLHAMRAVIICIVLVSFFWGLARLPLAEAIGLSFVAPLFALVLAALLLRERIQREAIVASIAGIGGVLLITAGQFGHASYTHEVLLGTLSVLVSTLFYAYNLILMRQQAQIARPSEIIFFQNLTLVVVLGLASPWFALSLPFDNWLPIAGVTALSLGGQFLMSWSYARAEAQYLVPTEYSAFIWAILLGWVFFDEGVTWTTLIGACMIIVGCLRAAYANPKMAEPMEANI